MKFQKLLLIFFLFGLLISGCDIYQPSQVCGEITDPDRQAFTEYIASIQIAHQDADSSTEQVGRVFPPPAHLSLTVAGHKDGELRLCVFETTRKGSVVYDETLALVVGEQNIPLGEFEDGSYIIRVYVDDTLVENLSFLIRD